MSAHSYELLTSISTRGDTLTWQFNGLHNIHFDTKAVHFALHSEIDGKATVLFTRS